AVSRAVGHAGHESNGTADRVPPGKGALRPSQNFDAFEIEQIEDGAEQRRVVDVIDVYPYSGLKCQVEVILADATDRDLRRIAEPLRRLLHHNAGRLRRDVENRSLASRPHRFAADGGDRQGS